MVIIIIVGDVNLHIDDTSNHHSKAFLIITESHKLGHHVRGPTHNHGHTES